MSETLTEITSLVAVGTLEQRHASFDTVEVRAEGDRIIFDGHAAVFDRLSDDLGGFRERIQRGAFRKILDSSPDVRCSSTTTPT